MKSRRRITASEFDTLTDQVGQSGYQRERRKRGLIPQSFVPAKLTLYGGPPSCIIQTPDTFVLPISHHFKQNRIMEKETGPAAAIRGLARWATTPPQAYAVYLVCLFLVAGLSFYVGTLKPKKAVGLGPPPVSAPRN
jgi:hypothetical protein